MSRPFLLAQLSDPHIGAEWADPDPVAGLAAAVEAVRSLPQQPDAVPVPGDLADHAADAEYEQVRELLAPLPRRTTFLAGSRRRSSSLSADAGGERARVPLAGSAPGEG